MGKFIGTLGVVVGYSETLIDGIPSGVNKPIIETYHVSGDVLSNGYRNEQGRSINDDVSISNRFSILATPYLVTLMSETSALSSMYLDVYGIKWKISALELHLPRVYITLGGVWNEEAN